ncbi:hypothetical protein IWX65_001351 [Arthrobacter sp. CAN_A214]|uniref:hypothetical protein n=1 Tax=Arthrobacter sp. CAN_A214 TaxID=2787720 RepID=UPI0018CB4FEA
MRTGHRASVAARPEVLELCVGFRGSGGALALGGVPAGEAFVSLGMLSLELGLISAVGAGVSALATRLLFSIVITYMLVAMLTVATLIVFGLAMPLVSERTTVTRSYQSYNSSALLDETSIPDPADPRMRHGNFCAGCQDAAGRPRHQCDL